MLHTISTIATLFLFPNNLLMASNTESKYISCHPHSNKSLFNESQQISHQQTKQNPEETVEIYFYFIIFRRIFSVNFYNRFGNFFWGWWKRKAAKVFFYLFFCLLYFLLLFFSFVLFIFSKRGGNFAFTKGA